MNIVNPQIEDYTREHTSRESEELTTLVEKADQELEHIGMISGRVAGELLSFLVHLSGAKRALEIGTFVGYSSLKIAEALPEDGSLITCDVNERYAAIARSAFEQSPHGHKITMKMGPALETIKTLDQSFDVIFIDADKANYPQYYEGLIPKLSQEGVMVIDNVLWSGTVLSPEDDKTRAIDRCNKMVASDERVAQVMLTVRDGVTIIRKR